MHYLRKSLVTVCLWEKLENKISKNDLIITIYKLSKGTI